MEIDKIIEKYLIEKMDGDTIKLWKRMDMANKQRWAEGKKDGSMSDEDISRESAQVKAFREQQTKEYDRLVVAKKKWDKEEKKRERMEKKEKKMSIDDFHKKMDDWGLEISKKKQRELDKKKPLTKKEKESAEFMRIYRKNGGRM